jgi:polar amino acid transport system substrate-binding protein
MIGKKMRGVGVRQGLLLLLVGAVLLCAGCEKYRTLDVIKKKGELVMFTNANFPPYEYVGDAGKPDGLDIDIGNEIAKDIGVSLRIINADFDGFSIALQNGQADMAISAISITEERKESLDFSEPYVVTIQYILKNEGDTRQINTLNDLAGQKIGVQLGTTGDFLISEAIDQGPLTGTGAAVVQYKSLQEAVMALKKGDLAAIVSDEGPIKNLVGVNPGLVCFSARYDDGPLPEEAYGIAVAKGNRDLLVAINRTLDRLIESGFVRDQRAYHEAQSGLN